MDAYTRFFVLIGVTSFCWNLCKLIFWFDNPHKHTRGKK